MNGRILAAVAAVAGVLAAFAGTPYRAKLDVQELAGIVEREEDHVTALELAAWLRGRKPGLRVIDVRTPAEFAAFHLPGAERMPLQTLVTARFAPAETLVLYSGGGAHAAQGWVFLRARGYRNVYFLRGGIAEWIAEVRQPVKPTALTRYFGSGGC
jgi:rhodanese-related sulfurtransferase